MSGIATKDYNTVLAAFPASYSALMSGFYTTSNNFACFFIRIIISNIFVQYFLAFSWWKLFKYKFINIKYFLNILPIWKLFAWPLTRCRLIILIFYNLLTAEWQISFPAPNGFKLPCSLPRHPTVNSPIFIQCNNHLSRPYQIFLPLVYFLLHSIMLYDFARSRTGRWVGTNFL